MKNWEKWEGVKWAFARVQVAVARVEVVIARVEVVAARCCVGIGQEFFHNFRGMWRVCAEFLGKGGVSKVVRRRFSTFVENQPVVLENSVFRTCSALSDSDFASCKAADSDFLSCRVF